MGDGRRARKAVMFKKADVVGSRAVERRYIEDHPRGRRWTIGACQARDLAKTETAGVS